MSLSETMEEVTNSINSTNERIQDAQKHLRYVLSDFQIFFPVSLRTRKKRILFLLLPRQDVKRFMKQRSKIEERLRNMEKLQKRARNTSRTLIIRDFLLFFFLQTQRPDGNV